MRVPTRVVREVTPRSPANALARSVVRQTAGLSKVDQRAAFQALSQVVEHAQRERLGFVPVFGYLSLMTNNHHELGLASQAEVKPGKHVVPASLGGHTLDFVASSVARGTPTRPGVVAGLRSDPAASTSGVVLKLPLKQAEQLLTRVMQREMRAENDLEPTPGSSASMYTPRALPVTLESGETVQALVFITNPKSPKALASYGVFSRSDAEQQAPTAQQTGWLMGAQGERGKAFDYWRAYAQQLEAQGAAVPKVVREAIQLGEVAPSDERLELLSQRAKAGDEAARAELDAFAKAFAGAASPVDVVKRQRKPGWR